MLLADEIYDIAVRFANALLKHGVHDVGCPAIGAKGKCDCGLEQALPEAAEFIKDYGEVEG